MSNHKTIKWKFKKKQLWNFNKMFFITYSLIVITSSKYFQCVVIISYLLPGTLTRLLHCLILTQFDTCMDGNRFSIIYRLRS